MHKFSVSANISYRSTVFDLHDGCAASKPYRCFKNVVARREVLLHAAARAGKFVSEHICVRTKKRASRWHLDRTVHVIHVDKILCIGIHTSLRGP